MIKKIFKIDIRQMALAAMLISIGIVSTSFIRIGHFELITNAIYIILGLFMPLWLALTGALLIDNLSMLIKGEVGYWFWAYALIPALIVFISFFVKLFIFKNKTRKSEMVIGIVLMSILIVASILIFTLESEQLSFSKIDHTNWSKNTTRIENDEELVIRLVTNIGAIIGLIMISSLFFIKIWKFNKGEKEKGYITLFLMVIMISIIVDWFYNPFATLLFYKHIGSPKLGINAYRIFMSMGVWKSLFHIAIYVPIIYSFFYVNKKLAFDNKIRY
ncbi:MAG: hypothetical protein KAG91_01965 [Mycoplasmataceae bacterium]|nr:hypothetical protein [Mycoplasmataceae bacterium]